MGVNTAHLHQLGKKKQLNRTGKIFNLEAIKQGERHRVRSAVPGAGGFLPMAAPGLPAEIRPRECRQLANPRGVLAADARTGGSVEAVGSGALGRRRVQNRFEAPTRRCLHCGEASGVTFIGRKCHSVKLQKSGRGIWGYFLALEIKDSSGKSPGCSHRGLLSASCELSHFSVKFSSRQLLA